MAKLDIMVRVNGRHWDGYAGKEIPELYQECFEPIRTSDESMLMPFGEISHQEARRVLKVRRDAAEILAKELTEMILSEMGKNDTYNGYRRDE